MNLKDWFAGDPATDVSVTSQLRTELGLSSYLPYGYLATPDIVVTDYDGLGAIFEVEWNDVLSASRQERIDHCRWIGRGLNDIGKRVFGSSGWMVQQYALRCETPPLALPSYLESDGRQVLAQSHIDYMDGKRGRWRHLIAVTHLPPVAQMSWLEKWLVTGEPQVESSFEEVREKFEIGLQSYAEQMLAGKLRRLGTHPADARRSDLLEAIFHCLYDEEQAIYVGDPFESAPIGGLLAARDIFPGRKPRINGKHMRTLSITGYPSTTRPNMFDAFLQNPVAGSRFSTRLVFQSHDKAKHQLEVDRRAHAMGKFSLLAMVANPQGFQTSRVNRTAAKKEESAEQAIEIHDSGLVSSGHASANATLFADTLPEMEEKIQTVRRALTGFVVNVEDINATRAYFGNVPFDAIRAREIKIHTTNAARIGPSSSAWAGRKTWNCSFCKPNTPASFIALTRTGEDFHVDTHDGQNRSALLIGKMGSGKTSLMNKMMAEDIIDDRQQVFGFDKNRGMLVTTLFLGGEYREAKRFWLFKDLEKKPKRDYLTRFIGNLIEFEVKERVDRDSVKLALERMLCDRPSNRNLGTFMAAFSPTDLSEKKSHTSVIRDFALGGIHGGVFDGEYDPSENTGQRVVYELGHFMTGNQDERVAAPVMLWLLHACGDRYPGHSTKVYFDESWALMKKKAVADEIDEELRTMRFRHAGAVFATHSFADILNSPIASTVMAACPTRFIMPDKDALGYGLSFYRDGLQLTLPQTRAIQDGQPHECAMVTSSGFAMFKTPLSPAEVAVLGCTGKDQVDAAVTLMEKYPDDWRYRFLLNAGCEKEANAIRQLGDKCNSTLLRKAIFA